MQEIAAIGADFQQLTSFSTDDILDSTSNPPSTKVPILFIKITAALSYHRVRGLYFLAVIFVSFLHVYMMQ